MTPGEVLYNFTSYVEQAEDGWYLVILMDGQPWQRIGPADEREARRMLQDYLESLRQRPRGQA